MDDWLTPKQAAAASEAGVVWISPAEAAALLGISLSAMRLRIRRREVPAFRLRRSRLLRLRRADVLSLLEPLPTPEAATRERLEPLKARPRLVRTRGA